MRTFSAARQFVTWAPLAALLTVLLQAPAAAQEPVRSFDQPNTRLTVGDTTRITDPQGQELAGPLERIDVGPSLASAVRLATARGLDDEMRVAFTLPPTLGLFRVTGDNWRPAWKPARAKRASLGAARSTSASCGNWVCRHPVWFGTIVGAVVGAAIVGAAEGSEAAFTGFYGGAAVGALGGVILSALR